MLLLRASMYLLRPLGLGVAAVLSPGPSLRGAPPNCSTPRYCLSRRPSRSNDLGLLMLHNDTATTVVIPRVVVVQ